MDYIISTEATCDLNEENLKPLDVRVIDMLYFVDGTPYGQNDNRLPLSQFYAKMREGARASTSMINEAEAEAFFERLLAEGKDILHVAFSSGLSGTYNCLVKAAETLNKTHENKIYVVDSKCGSTGEGLIVEYAAKLRAEGKDIRENVKILTEEIDNVNAFFTVDNLKYLVAGGRISKSTALIGNIVHIKPLIYADGNGKIVQGGKTVGNKKALGMLAEKVKEKFTNLYNKIYVSHADCVEGANFLIEKIKMILPKARVVLEEIGPVMGSHCGPGTVAVFFFGKRRSF